MAAGYGVKRGRLQVSKSAPHAEAGLQWVQSAASPDRCAPDAGGCGHRGWGQRPSKVKGADTVLVHGILGIPAAGHRARNWGLPDSWQRFSDNEMGLRLTYQCAEQLFAVDAATDSKSLCAQQAPLISSYGEQRTQSNNTNLEHAARLSRTLL